MKYKLLFLLCSMLFLTVSCSTFTTSQEVKNNRITGNIYYLPKGKIRITGEWKTVPTSTLAIEVQNPKEPASKVTNTVVTPYALFVVTISGELEADPSCRYYLKPNKNIFYDDKTTLSVNAKGLLTTGHSTTEDKTQAIVGEVAGMAGQTLNFMVGAGTGMNAWDLKDKDNKDNKDVGSKFKVFRPFNVVIDPRDFNREKIALSECGFNLEITPGNKIDLGILNFSSPQQGDINGIVFRPLVPYQVKISNRTTGFVDTTYVSESKMVMLPDTKVQLVMDYSRAAFVKKRNDVTFVDGVPTEISRELPSQALGVLGIPKAILTAIVPLPLELKQTQIDNLKANQELDGL